MHYKVLIPWYIDTDMTSLQLTAYLGSLPESHCVGQLVASFIHTPALGELWRLMWVALHGHEPAQKGELTRHIVSLHLRHFTGCHHSTFLPALSVTADRIHTLGACHVLMKSLAPCLDWHILFQCCHLLEQFFNVCNNLDALIEEKIHGVLV